MPDVILRNGRITTLDGCEARGERTCDQGWSRAGGRHGREIMALRAARHEGDRSRGPPRRFRASTTATLHVIRGGLNYNMELRWDGVPSLADAHGAC